MKLKEESKTPPFPTWVKQGQVFRHEEGDIYMVCRSGMQEYVLISLFDGNRWATVTQDIDKVFNDCEDAFTYVPAGTELTFAV